MCRSLRARGVDCMIATTDADGGSRLEVPLAVPTAWNDIPAIFFRRQGSDAFKYARGLRTWLSKNVRGFDVVHVHGLLSYAPLAAAAACWQAGVPYIIRPLGTIDPW